MAFRDIWGRFGRFLWIVSQDFFGNFAATFLLLYKRVETDKDTSDGLVSFARTVQMYQCMKAST